MFVDDSLVFDFTYDSISFFQTAQMKLIENREFGKAEGLSYHKLFLKENSLFLPGKVKTCYGEKKLFYKLLSLVLFFSLHD